MRAKHCLDAASCYHDARSVVLGGIILERFRLGVRLKRRRRRGQGGENMNRGECSIADGNRTRRTFGLSQGGR